MENSDSLGPVSFTDSDDTSFLSAESEVLDDLINKRYRIEKRIGRGAFGVVDLVTDTKTNESKALKRVICESANEVNDAIKEVFTMRAVQHENLLAIESVFVHTDNDTYVCFVSDFYEKGDLDKYVQWRKGNESYFDEIQICQFMLQLVAATKQLHDSNLIHRDIKPANIFVSNDLTKLIIGDFGLVKQLEKTFASTIAGTLKYMPPEVLTTKKYSYGADVWSLGCVMLELCTLSLEKNLYMEVYTNNMFFSQLRQEMEQHGYTSTMSMILKRMLETDHNTRITCTELVQLLTEHMKSLQSGTYVEPTASLAYRKCDADDCTNAVKFECITCGGVSLCSKCFGDTHKFGIYKKHERTEIIIEKEEFVVKYYAKQLAHWIKESKNFVVFTGGGISVSAGVPDMRNRGIMKPYEFIICPTVTHMAIAELCRRGLIKHVISTNVDGLHIRSGVPSNMLSEMHGNGFLEVCRKCNKQYHRDYRSREADKNIYYRDKPNEKLLDHQTTRTCDCGQPLFDTIVNFRETIDQKVYTASLENASQSDMMLVLGSGLAISPSKDLPELCKRGLRLNTTFQKVEVDQDVTSRLCIVNLTETQKDYLADLVIHSKCDAVISELMSELDIPIPDFVLNHTFVAGVRAARGKNYLYVESSIRDGNIASILRSVTFRIGKDVTVDTKHLTTVFETAIPNTLTKATVQMTYNLPIRADKTSTVDLEVDCTEEGREYAVQFNVNTYEYKVILGKETQKKPTWLWFNNEGTYTKYSQDECTKLETAYRAFLKQGKETKICVISDMHYVDFQQMVQVNKFFENRRRKVKRQ